MSTVLAVIFCIFMSLRCLLVVTVSALSSVVEKYRSWYLHSSLYQCGGACTPFGPWQTTLYSEIFAL